MGINNYIVTQYKKTLEKRYADFKALLGEKNYVPDVREVWKMYEKRFNENHGIYALAAELLEVELYDETGRLNEMYVALDNINKMMSDYCMAYVAGMQKRGENKNATAKI